MDASDSIDNLYRTLPDEPQPAPKPKRVRKVKAKLAPAPPVAPAKAPAKKKRKAKPKQPEFNFPDGSDFVLPGVDLLKVPPPRSAVTDEGALRRASTQLHKVMADYGIEGEMGAVRPGPVVTLFEFEPAPGVKSQRVINLSDDIARNMSAQSARIAVVPGRNAMGVEMPNRRRETVWLRDMLNSELFKNTDMNLPLILGEDIGGQPFITDLSKMPHLLIAGTTGSGKSVGVNAMILSLMYTLTPEQCKFIMIDPKMLELSVYDGAPHLLAPVVTEPKKAVVALKWTVREMEDRYRKMSKMGVFPTRISFRVGSKIDSRTILGEQGAEQLLGNGDMLFMGTGRPRRLHGPFVSDGEVEKIANFVKAQGAPSYLEDITTEREEGPEDAKLAGGGSEGNSLFDQAVAIVARDRKASTSYIQRKLSIGYNRAADLIERMEQEGMISAAMSGGKRDILLPEQDDPF